MKLPYSVSALCIIQTVWVQISAQPLSSLGDLGQASVSLSLPNQPHMVMRIKGRDLHTTMSSLEEGWDKNATN